MTYPVAHIIGTVTPTTLHDSKELMGHEILQIKETLVGSLAFFHFGTERGDVLWEVDFWDNLILKGNGPRHQQVLAHDGCDYPSVWSLKHLQQAADHGMVHHALKINLWIRMFRFLRIIKMTFSTFSNSALVSFSSLFLTTIYEFFSWCNSDVHGRKTIFNPLSPFSGKQNQFQYRKKIVFDWPIARLEHFRHNSGQVHWTSVRPCHGHNWGWSWVFNTDHNKHAFQFKNRCFHQFQWRRPSCWEALQHWCSRYHPRQKDWTSDNERR